MKRRPAAPSAAVLAFQKPTRKARLGIAQVTNEKRILARGELRHDVIIRANGRCETCRVPVPPGELHHVLSGSQRRRRESMSSLLFVCVACHHALHRNDLEVLFWASSWANANGFVEARAAIQKRIEKVTEAKWASLRGIA